MAIGDDPGLKILQKYIKINKTNREATLLEFVYSAAGSFY